MPESHPEEKPLMDPSGTLYPEKTDLEKAHAQRLPRVYAQGTAKTHDCSLASLRYMCDLDDQRGCGGYPQLFPMGKIMSNWRPDAPDAEPEAKYNSLCRFNFSDPHERRLAVLFHDFEVPFVVYAVPELDQATNVWTDVAIQEACADERLLTRVSPSHHFQFYDPALAWENSRNSSTTPGYTKEHWTYGEFLAQVAKNPSPRAHEPHYYLQLHLQSNKRGSCATFMRDTLSMFLSTSSFRYNDFFLRTRHNVGRGVYCRVGQRGLVVGGHVDGKVNMIAIVRGSKRYILSPPSSCACQYLMTSGPSTRHTRVNWTAIDGQTFPLAHGCPGTEVVLRRGDVLYLPSYWYHQTLSLDQSIQCNVRSGGVQREEPVEPFLAKCFNRPDGLS